MGVAKFQQAQSTWKNVCKLEGVAAIKRQHSLENLMLIFIFFHSNLLSAKKICFPT